MKTIIIFSMVSLLAFAGCKTSEDILPNDPELAKMAQEFAFEADVNPQGRQFLALSQPSASTPVIKTGRSNVETFKYFKEKENASAEALHLKIADYYKFAKPQTKVIISLDVVDEMLSEKQSFAADRLIFHLNTLAEMGSVEWRIIVPALLKVKDLNLSEFKELREKFHENLKQYVEYCIKAREQYLKDAEEALVAGNTRKSIKAEILAKRELNGIEFAKNGAKQIRKL